MQKSKLTLAVWICNIVIAVLSVLAIVSYLFMPFWSISISYTIDAETIEEMAGEDIDFDAKEAVGDGVTIGISLQFDTGVLLGSFGGEEEAVEALIDDNVTVLINQLTDTLNSVAERIVRTLTSSIVKNTIYENIKDLLELGDDEVADRLSAVGITPEYISSKTNAVIDKIYDEGSTVGDVCDAFIDAVNDIYSHLASSDDVDLQGALFTEEDKQNFRETVENAMKMLAAGDGPIDGNELIAGLFLYILDSMKEGEGEEGNSSGGNNYDSALVIPLNEGEGTKEPASVRLKAELKNFLVDLIPEDVTSIVAWVMRGMMILFLFSSFWWVYIIIKLIVKLIKRKTPAVIKNPTVKLKAVIWLGWLPFMILVGLPTILLAFASGFLADMLPPELASAGISFSSSGLFAALAALVAFGISIFYIVARKKLKDIDVYATSSSTESHSSNNSSDTAAEQEKADQDSLNEVNSSNE